MSNTLAVNVSGPAFSLLFYENVKSDHDQQGFLLGEIFEKKIRTITDYDQHVVNTERSIIINSAIPCPHKCYFYGAGGNIHKKIIDLLGEQTKKVVAWYKFKYASGFKLTLREKILHKRLSKFFPVPAELFTCCLLTADDSSMMRSTHVYTQTFVRYCINMYEQIPMHIVNLSDSNSGYQGANPASETFNKLIKPINADCNKTQGLIVIKKIQGAVQKHINELVINLAKSEQELYALETDIKNLKQNLKWNRECDISKNNLSPTASTASITNGESDTAKNTENQQCSSKESSPDHTHKSVKRITRQTSKGRLPTTSSSPDKDSEDANVEDGTYPKARSTTKSNVTYSQITQKNKN